MRLTPSQKKKRNLIASAKPKPRTCATGKAAQRSVKLARCSTHSKAGQLRHQSVPEASCLHHTAHHKLRALGRHRAVPWLIRRSSQRLEPSQWWSRAWLLFAGIVFVIVPCLRLLLPGPGSSWSSSNRPRPPPPPPPPPPPMNTKLRPWRRRRKAEVALAAAAIQHKLPRRVKWICTGGEFWQSKRAGQQAGTFCAYGMLASSHSRLRPHLSGEEPSKRVYPSIDADKTETCSVFVVLLPTYCGLRRGTTLYMHAARNALAHRHD